MPLRWRGCRSGPLAEVTLSASAAKAGSNSKNRRRTRGLERGLRLPIAPNEAGLPCPLVMAIVDILGDPRDSMKNRKHPGEVFFWMIIVI